MRTYISAGLVALGLMAATAPAQADNVVVELFTSQGCSSCPPADALLGEIAEREGVIALSLHVDYWDYLGWKDQFAIAEFATRQRNYAHAAGGSMIYTPQMVIAGKDHIVGTKAMQLADTLRAHAARGSDVALSVTRKDGQISIDAAPKSGKSVPSRMVVQLMHFVPEQSVAIERGENAGRTITYHNVVNSWSIISEWNGAAPLQKAVPAQNDNPAVVIIQDGPSGPILAAVRID